MPRNIGNTKHECCICLRGFSGHGCNPAPFGESGDRCCTECDDRFVTPVRILVGLRPLNPKMEQFLCAIAKYGNFVVEQKRKGVLKLIKSA